MKKIEIWAASAFVLVLILVAIGLAQPPTKQVKASPEATYLLENLRFSFPGRLVQSDFVYDIAWSPDGDYIAVATERGLLFYDPATREKVGTWMAKWTVTNVMYSPSGDYVFAAYASGNIRVFSRYGARLGFLTSSHGAVSHWALSSDEKILGIIYGRQEVVFWYLPTKTLLYSLENPDPHNPIVGIRFAADDRAVIYQYPNLDCSIDLNSGSFIQETCEIDFQDGRSFGGYLGLASHMSSGAWALVGRDGAIQLFIDEGHDPVTISYGDDTGGGYTVEFDQSGQWLAYSTHRGLGVFDLEKSDEVHHFDLLPRSIAFDPSSSTLAVGGYRSELATIDLDSGEISAWGDAYGWVTAMAIAPHSEILAIAYSSGWVRGIHLRETDEVFSYQFSGEAERLAFSEDEGILIAETLRYGVIPTIERLNVLTGDIELIPRGPSEEEEASFQATQQTDLLFAYINDQGSVILDPQEGNQQSVLVFSRSQKLVAICKTDTDYFMAVADYLGEVQIWRFTFGW